MFEGFGGALATIAEPHVILTLCVGSIIGLIFGAVPGLGGILAMSMLLPFTFTWDPITAIYLFSGIMGASSFGGSISAILLNTPGTPVNAATCFDGYPMAKRGEAARALGLSAGACLLGALFGLLILALLIQVMRPLVLAFGHPEIFWAGGVRAGHHRHRQPGLAAERAHRRRRRNTAVPGGGSTNPPASSATPWAASTCGTAFP